MRPDLSILYRGPLSSCNYACDYCPFAKRHETAAELAVDRTALERFVSWAEGLAARTLGVFFTPWGEALTRAWYRDAVVRLSRQRHFLRVAVQTNLSCPLEWLSECATDKLGLWCTYHPSQVSRGEFLSQCERLRALQVRHSVGMVGLPTDFDEIERMRRELPPETYLWINAWDTGGGSKFRYSEAEIGRLETVDPLFRFNLADHDSQGRHCRTGNSVISVDGDGTIRRCHFVRKPLGNLYTSALDEVLGERTCPNRVCNCHIGYVHLDDLGLQPVFGEGILERVPVQPITHTAVPVSV